jgi:hypothetical protein
VGQGSLFLAAQTDRLDCDRESHGIVNAVADDARNESMLSIVFADVCAETLPQSLFELDLGLKIESRKASRGSKSARLAEIKKLRCRRCAAMIQSVKHHSLSYWKRCAPNCFKILCVEISIASAANLPVLATANPCVSLRSLAVEIASARDAWQESIFHPQNASKIIRTNAMR